MREGQCQARRLIVSATLLLYYIFSFLSFIFLLRTIVSLTQKMPKGVEAINRSEKPQLRGLESLSFLRDPILRIRDIEDFLTKSQKVGYNF